MVFRGGGPPRGRGRARPFRARGRGWRGPPRGRGGPNHGGHHDEGLRITLRNAGPDSQRPEYDQRSDPRDHRFGRREDYKFGGERSYREHEGYEEQGYGDDRHRRDTPESGRSPPRKRPYVEPDIPPEESLRITVGNDLYGKNEPPPPDTHYHGDGGAEEGPSERRDSWPSERYDEHRWEGDKDRYGDIREPYPAPGEDKGHDNSYQGHGYREAQYLREFGRERGGRFGDSHLGRQEEEYNPQFGQSEEYRPDYSGQERDRSRSPGPGRRSRSRGRSRERRGQSVGKGYSRDRRSRSRSGSRGRRSRSRGRSQSRGRSFSRNTTGIARVRSKSRRSGSRGRGSMSPARRGFRRSDSRGRRSISRGSRSRSRERGYSRGGSRSPRRVSGGAHRNVSRGRSLEHGARGGSREAGRHSRSGSRDRASSSSSSSSSSSRSSRSEHGLKSKEISEKEYEAEMYRRLKTELSKNYADPREREEQIAKHIREMAKLSPALFRQFMSKNAGNLSAMTLGVSESHPAEGTEPETDPAVAEETGDSRPLRSILKRKGDSPSPARELGPSDNPSGSSLTQIEKVIQSLRKGAKPEPEKEPVKEPTPPSGALRQLSSYADDIDDEEEFLYGESSKTKDDKASAASSLPFWSANRFEEKEEKLPEDSPLDPQKPSLDMFQDLVSQKPVEPKTPSALDSFEDKEKSYEKWRATFLQKPKLEKEAEPAKPSVPGTAESGENLSSTVENILKSIGFNFDLSRRMQELARQKKEQEQQGLMINQSASFLGSGGLPGDIKATVFEKEGTRGFKSEDVANLLEEVKMATQIAQEKARKAKDLEERHVHPHRKDSYDRDANYRDETGRRWGSPVRPQTEQDRGLYMAPGASHSPYIPPQPQDQLYTQEYIPHYNEYGQFDYYPGHGDEGLYPKPIRTSNLISLAGDTDGGPSMGSKKESSPPPHTRGRPGDRRQEEHDRYGHGTDERGLRHHPESSHRRTSGSIGDISPRRRSRLSEERGFKEETGHKRSGERILIVKKVKERMDDSPGSDSGFSRRIVLPPKDKPRSSDSHREVIRRSASPSEPPRYSRRNSPMRSSKGGRRASSPLASPKRKESPSSGRSYKRPGSPVVSPQRSKQPREKSPDGRFSSREKSHASRTKYESARSKYEPSKSAVESPKPKTGSAKDAQKAQAPKIDTERVKKLALEKLKLVKQQDESKEKIRSLVERKEKIRILEGELSALKLQHNELLRKRRRQKDGHKDPLLAENVKLQEEISGQIKALREGRDEDSGSSKHGKSSASMEKSSSSSTDTKSGEKSAVEETAKKEEKKVRYEYFDPGSHWCRLCNVMCGHMFDFFKHLESKKHQQKLDPFDKPWLVEALQKSEGKGKMKEGPVQAHPIKGMEFMMATAAFYCTLCKEFCGDVSIAESHMKSDEHTQKYKEYIDEHPYYEKRFMLERSASLSMQRPYSPEPEPEDSSDETESQSSESKRKPSGHSSGVDKSKVKDDKDRARSEEGEKKSDRDGKSKDDKRNEKDGDKHDGKTSDRDDRGGKDEKDKDGDGRRNQKKEIRGIPSENESRMYSDREEFRNVSSTRQRKDDTGYENSDKRKPFQKSDSNSTPKSGASSAEQGKEKAEKEAVADAVADIYGDPRSVRESVTASEETKTEKEQPSTGPTSDTATDGKESDSEGKGKIPIKLTGKSGIKTVVSTPSFLKVFTRPIPKSSTRARLLPGRGQAAGGGGTALNPAPPNEEPIPLEDFLTVGSKQNMPVPIVPDTPKDLPAPRDPKTGKIESEEAARIEEMKQLGIDPTSLTPSIAPVAPPPPSQNLSLPLDMESKSEDTASSDSTDTGANAKTTDSKETVSDSAEKKSEATPDTTVSDLDKEKKDTEEKAGDSKDGMNKDGDKPVLEGIPLPAKTPAPIVLTASGPQPLKGPPPPPPPPTTATTTTAAATSAYTPTTSYQSGYGTAASQYSSGYYNTQSGYNTSQSGYSMQSGYNTYQGGYNAYQGGYNAQGGYGYPPGGYSNNYGPPMMPPYPPRFPCSGPMYGMRGPGPMPFQGMPPWGPGPCPPYPPPPVPPVRHGAAAPSGTQTSQASNNPPAQSSSGDKSSASTTATADDSTPETVAEGVKAATADTSETIVATASEGAQVTTAKPLDTTAATDAVAATTLTTDSTATKSADDTATQPEESATTKSADLTTSISAGDAAAEPESGTRMESADRSESAVAPVGFSDDSGTAAKSGNTMVSKPVVAPATSDVTTKSSEAPAKTTSGTTTKSAPAKTGTPTKAEAPVSAETPGTQTDKAATASGATASKPAEEDTTSEMTGAAASSPTGATLSTLTGATSSKPAGTTPSTATGATASKPTGAMPGKAAVTKSSKPTGATPSKAVAAPGKLTGATATKLAGDMASKVRVTTTSKAAAATSEAAGSTSKPATMTVSVSAVATSEVADATFSGLPVTTTTKVADASSNTAAATVEPPGSFSAASTGITDSALSVPQSSKPGTGCAQAAVTEPSTSAPDTVDSQGPKQVTSPVTGSGGEAAAHTSAKTTSSEVSSSGVVITPAATQSADVAATVSDSQAASSSSSTVLSPRVNREESPSSDASPAKGRRTRTRAQSKPTTPVRQTRSRTARRAAAESLSPAAEDSALGGEDSHQEEPLADSQCSQESLGQNSSEAGEASPGSRVLGLKQKVTGRAKKVTSKKEMSDSHEAVPVVVKQSSSTTGCVLDLTNPPVDSSVQSLLSTEVTSSISTVESSASEAQCRTPMEEQSATSEPVVSAPASQLVEAEASALNLTVPPQQRKARRGRVMEQTEPEDLSARAGPQDLSRSKDKSVLQPEMPMDLSVRLFRLPVTQSGISVSLSEPGNMVQEEAVQSSSGQISSSSGLQRMSAAGDQDVQQQASTADLPPVKDTLLSSTSAANPSTSSFSEEPDLAVEAVLLADDQPNDLTGSSQLGVDPDGDPVDFSLAPIDFEQLVGMDDSNTVPAPEGNDNNADSTDPAI